MVWWEDVVAGPHEMYTTEDIITILEELHSKGVKKVRIYDLDEKKYVAPYTEDYGSKDPVVSWRGKYKNCAITVKPDSQAVDIAEFIELLKSIDGAVRDGYKGGRYRLSTKDLVRFVTEWSDSSNRVPLFIVREKEDTVVLAVGIVNDFIGWYGEEI